MYEGKRRNSYFEKDIDKYETKGIAKKVPFAYRVLMWKTIGDLVDAGIEADYLQVFEFHLIDDSASGDKIQQMEYRQEVPEYKKVVTFPVIGSGLDKVTIFVIDDGIGYATMCFPEER